MVRVVQGVACRCVAGAGSLHASACQPSCGGGTVIIADNTARPHALFLRCARQLPRPTCHSLPPPLTHLQAAEQLGLPRIVSIQNSYSLLVRGPFETDLAETCAQRQCNVGLLAYSPLAGEWGQGACGHRWDSRGAGHVQCQQRWARAVARRQCHTACTALSCSSCRLLAGGALTGKYIEGKNIEKARLNLFQGGWGGGRGMLAWERRCTGAHLPPVLMQPAATDRKRLLRCCSACPVASWVPCRPCACQGRLAVHTSSVGLPKPAGYMARYNKSLAKEAVAAYAEVARQHGLTPTQLALAWVHSRWFVASTM